MSALPRGAVVIDLVVPPGTSQHVADLQTRIGLVAASDWRVVADDGTMQESAMPMQPVLGNDERLWVWRSAPFTPTESLHDAAALAVQLAAMCQARVAAVGVVGLYSWGFVLVDDVHTLHGLLLLNWLYDPRVSAGGEALQSTQPAEIAAEMEAKSRLFPQLWTVHASQTMMSQLPPGALKAVESHQALSLLGPGGRFDPRVWQNFALQLVIPFVQAVAAHRSSPDDSADAGVASAAAPGTQPGAHAPLPGAGPLAASPAAVPSPPDDGLTPLARAQVEAERRRTAGEEQDGPPPVAEQSEVVGPGVTWHEAGDELVLWVPAERFDSSLLRKLQGGDFDQLRGNERPTMQQQERWSSAGSPFVSELNSFARLFLDGVPLHRQAFEAAASEEDGCLTLCCHLPRVCRVRVVVSGGGDARRRIVVSSNQELAAEQVLRLAGP